jgi:hypothetical protein
MNVDRGKANRATLEAQLARIMGNLRITDDRSGALGPPVKCTRCKDLGVIEWISGEFRVCASHLTTATPERPVFTQCDCTRRVADEAPKSRRYSAA